MQFPSGLHRHDTKVLDCGLGAVARTTGHGHLELMWHQGTPNQFFQTNPHLDGQLGPKAAPLLAHAGFDRTQSLAIGMT